MADDIEEKTDATDTEEKTTETEQVKNPEKVFKQDEVNKIVAREVSQEKQKNKKLADSWESEKQTFVTQIDAYEKIISSTIEDMKKGVSADVLELLAEKTALEQYDWLVKHSKKEKKTTIPETPKPEEKQKSNSIRSRNLY